jgi:integrase
MAVTNTKFMDSIEKKLAEKLAGTSIKTYMSKLIILNSKQPFSSFAFLRNVKGIRGFIDAFDNLKTRRAYYAAIVSILTHMDMASSKTYKATAIVYKGLLAEVIDNINKEPTGIKSDKQDANWLDWEEVEDVLNGLNKKVKNYTRAEVSDSLLKRRLLSQHLLLSMYVLQPPRRSGDYLLLTMGDDEDDDLNWYDGKKLYFNNYKTAKTYGSQSFDANTQVRNVLNSAIDLFGLEEGDKILRNEDNKPFKDSSAITKALNRIFAPKKVSTTLLRHIYLTSKYGDIKTEQAEDAEAMGHSVATQQSTYVVKDQGRMVGKVDPDEKVSVGGKEWTDNHL